MDDVVVNPTPTNLQGNQIACLEHNHQRLYGEMIQYIPQRQLCWFRPIYLLIDPSTEEYFEGVVEIISQPLHGHNLAKQSRANSAKTLTAEFAPNSSASSNSDEAAQIIDLRSSSDLLWPAILFRPALDTEVIDFLAQLREIEPGASKKSSNHKYLHTFLRQVWRSHQDKF